MFNEKLFFLFLGKLKASQCCKLLTRKREQRKIYEENIIFKHPMLLLPVRGSNLLTAFLMNHKVWIGSSHTVVEIIFFCWNETFCCLNEEGRRNESVHCFGHFVLLKYYGEINLVKAEEKKKLWKLFLSRRGGCVRYVKLFNCLKSYEFETILNHFSFETWPDYI